MSNNDVFNASLSKSRFLRAWSFLTNAPIAAPKPAETAELCKEAEDAFVYFTIDKKEITIRKSSS